MTYKLKFLSAALEEWPGLGGPVKSPLKKQLAERLEIPIPAHTLIGYQSVYKIKLRSAGYRLAYEGVDDELIVYVLAVGKRDKGKVYSALKDRKSSFE